MSAIPPESAPAPEEAPVTEATTSATIEDRPFLVDGVPLDERQVSVLANLCAGRGMYGPRAPMELPEALALWRKRNHITAADGKHRWSVHSNSPTWREGLEEDERPCPIRIEEARFSEATGELWEVVLIREGWSANSRYYPRETLTEALPLFNCDIFAYGWNDAGNGMGHLPGSVRDRADVSRNKVGWTENARVREASGRVEIVADFHWADPVQRTRMAEAWRLGNRSFLGFSIDGTGTSAMGVAEGRRGPIVTKISHLSETTLVSDPAAGGRFERLVAAGGDPNEKQEEQTTMNQTRMRSFLRARLQESKRGAVDALDEKGLCEAVSTHLKEMGGHEGTLQAVKIVLDKGDVETAGMLLDLVLADIGKGAMEQPEPPVEDADKPAGVYEAKAAAALKQIREAEERVTLRECSMILRDRLAESKLAAPAQAWVRKQFEGRVFEEKALLESIDDQIKYLAEIQGGGEVQVPGSGRVLREGRDKLQAGLDLAFGYKPAADEKLYEGLRGKRHSLKHIYGELTGDHDVTGEIAEDRMQEATTSSISNLLGTSMEKALVQQYRDTPDEWSKVATINPNVDNFKLQSRVRWDGFADLATISESTSTDYTDLGYPGDAVSTYTIATYGGLITVTRQMIKNDDLQTIQDIPRRVGRAAKNKLNKYVFNGVAGAIGGTINGDTTYDSVALYNAAHFNYATTALSHAAFVAARAQLENQHEYGVQTAVNGSSFNNTTDPVQITVDSTTGFFQYGYAICGSEVVHIDSVDSSTTMTVARGKKGTTAAAHADNAAIYAVGTPLPISKIYAIAPFELRGTMEAILGSEKVAGSANNDYNFLAAEAKAGRIEPLFVNALWLGGDTNNWYLASDPKDIPSIEIAFMDNRQEPEVFVQDAPTVGNVFTRDNIRYKIRHEYAGKQVDWRGLQGNIVA